MREYYRYQAFGLNILSILELPDLKCHSFLQEDVSIIYGDTPDNLDPITSKGVLYQANKDNFLFKLDHIASYHVQAGMKITISPAENAVLKDVQLFLQGPIFGALMHQKGVLPLHGSSVTNKKRSTIFCGKSGTGKSTLAALLTQKGYSLLADDISVIKTDGKISTVIPGITKIKLWQDVAEQLYKDYSKFPRVRDQLLRYKIPDTPSKDMEETQIGNIIILEKKNSPGFELNKISGAEKFSLLVENTYRIQYIEGLETSLNHFREISELIKNVNVFILRRPSSPLLLNELVDFIEANHIL